ncbi:GNAT family N-acetyltransferase [Neobacillus mesonae]|nr:GNAT family N-acetyltransferase [Neobacillus mesonae]
MSFKKIESNEDLQIAFDIRKKIFVEEQGVPLQDEFDEYDVLNGSSEHILVYLEAQVAGTGRIRFVNGVGKLERICILKPYRKFGLGRIVINSLETIAKEKNIEQVKLHGQTHAEGFYQKLGYKTISDVFVEDGIPHVIMVKEI